jgi:large subunit ribosomal protein L9
MEVILLEKISHLGGLGDKVKVRSGYGRNYLIPQGKAKPATAANLQLFEERRAELEAQAAELLQRAIERKEQLEAMTVTVTARAGDEGKLFGSVGTADIAEAVVAAGGELTRQEVRMPDGPIRAVGTHEVVLHLHADVNGTLTVVVASGNNV